MVRLLVSRVLGFLRVMLGIHPDVPANDGAIVLFGLAILFTFLCGFFVIVAALGTIWTGYFLVILVTLYLFFDALYAAWRSAFYRHTVRVEHTAKSNGGTAGIWRYGEYVGAGFVLLSLLIPALVVYHVSLPYGLGKFTVNPSSMFVAADLTVAILAGSSIIKLRSVPSRPRTAHNNVLLLLCFASTISMMGALTEEARGQMAVPEGLFWTYVSILVSYAAHNVVLSILCPACQQKRPGHLAVLAVGFFGAGLLFAYGVGVLTVIPALLMPFVMVTGLILFASVSFRYFLEEPFVRFFLGKNAEKPSDPDGLGE